MPPTPIHRTRELSDKDTGEREEAGEAYVTRDALKVGLLKHESECHERGPLHELSEKVDKIRLWMAGASVIGLIATIAGPVILAWWLSTRLPAQQQAHMADAPAHLIPQAHAETKGPTP